MRAAWKLDADGGMARMKKLAEWLERDYPAAAGSLREGLEDCFTINRLDVPPSLHRCLATTNIIESRKKRDSASRRSCGCCVVKTGALKDCGPGGQKLRGLRSLPPGGEGGGSG